MIFNRFVSSTILILIALLVNRTEQCTRTAYTGAPSNNIIKAMEFIDSQLQLRNIDTEVFYVGSASGILVLDGSAYTEYLFVIQTAGVNSHMLYMKVSTFQNFTFVDEYSWFPLADTAQVNFVLGVLDQTIFASLSILGADLLTTGIFTNCNLNKEAYSYFYEIFGNRFRQDLNN